MAVIEKLYLISEISCHSRGNTVLLPFKILPKLMSKCPNRVSMYLLQPAFLSLDFGKTLVYLASCYHNFSSKVTWSLLACHSPMSKYYCSVIAYSYLVTVIYSVTMFFRKTLFNSEHVSLMNCTDVHSSVFKLLISLLLKKLVQYYFLPSLCKLKGY